MFAGNAIRSRDINVISLVLVCTYNAARGNDISSSSCLIHTCERGCLSIFSKEYDI